MKSRGIIGIVLTLLFMSMLTLAFNIRPVESGLTTWTVDDDGPADFSKIQDAINAASPGDTIFVYNGIYYENVVVNESVSLVGQNKSTTIIAHSGKVVTVTANNVVIKGFTIRDSGWDLYNSGIFMPSVIGCNISSNIITNNANGIWLQYSSSNTLLDNIVTNNNNDGIDLDHSSENTLIGNVVTKNYVGIRLHYSSGHTLKRNNMSDNDGRNFIITVGENTWGMSDFVHDIDVSNLVNGKPIYYWMNCSDAEVPSDAGFVALVNCSRISVRNLTLTKVMPGILLAYTNKSSIVYNSIEDTIFGIWAFDSPFQPSDNFLVGNEIRNCHAEGIRLVGSSNNVLSGNTISGSFIGIHLKQLFPLGDPSNNTICHNNFVDNTNQVSVEKTGEFPPNVWDDGYPSGGNYWSDYTGVDLCSGPNQNLTGSDGIWDHPYIIDDNNQDHYPLVNPWTPTETTVKVKGKDYPVTVVSNTTIDQMVVKQNFLKFRSSGPMGEKGYILVIFPIVNSTPIRIKIDNDWLIPPPFPVINTNGTHYFIYFEFTLSNHTIAIQFASTVSVGGISLPVDKLELLAPYIGLTILLAVIVMTIVYVKKRKRT